MELGTPSIEEHEDVLALWEACDIPSRPTGRDSRANVAAELAEQPEYWIGAYDEGRLVGIVVGTDDGRKGWVNRLAVHPEHRRQGIASKLLTALEAAFEAKELKLFAALVEEANAESRAFFEEHGYVDSTVRYYSKRESDEV